MSERVLTVEWLHIPLLLATPRYHTEIKWCRIGELVFVNGCDIDEIFPVAHGLSCGGQSRTVIIKILHLNSDGPCGSF